MFKCIGFDIDGVLQDYTANAVTTFFKLVPDYTGKINTAAYLLQNMFPDCTDNAIFDRMNEMLIDYYRSAPLLPHVVDLFKELRKHKIRTPLVTARGSGETDSSQLHEILDATADRFKTAGIPTDDIHIGFGDKVQIIKAEGIEVFVDDGAHNIIPISEVIPTCIMDQPYNKNVRGSNIYRIYNLYPKNFIDLMTYIENHRNYLGAAVEVQEKEALDLEFSKNSCVINQESFSDPTKPIFVVPLSGHNGETLLNRYRSMAQFDVIDLNDISKDMSAIENSVIKDSIRRIAPGKKLMYDNDLDSETYQLMTAVISDIIETVSNRQSIRSLIYGAQLFSLERSELLKYKDCPFILAGINEASKKIIIESRFKKDYNIALLFEDIDEVSMNVRKFKIIAGTDPSHLDGYINRQYFNSDGIDVVELRKGERPYNPENLQAAISLDTWLIGDCHISQKDRVKTDMIVNAINQVVKRTDNLLFLGDFDGKGGASKQEIKSFLNRIYCKNIYMIVGNNDGYEIQDYIDMGFKGISDKAEYVDGSRRIILTHCPILVERSDVNLHGHLHGGRVYWNIPVENHYDIWAEDYTPVKISQCLEILEDGLYKARNVIVSY